MPMSKSNVNLKIVLMGALAATCGLANSAQVNPGLAAAAQRDGRAEALIVLADQDTPALAPLAKGADYKAHRRALVDALRHRADAQQAGLRTWLDAHGVEYRAFWITNIVYARLSPGDLSALSARSEISRIEPNPLIRMSVPKPEAAGPAAPPVVQSIAWGVDKINAPKVWAAGVNGKGVTIGGEDTGYQWDHPALKPQYRGWNGSSADHNYNWHDSIHVPNGSCPGDSQAPCDDQGHGTHTAGTFAGDDHGSNQTGVAPGAKWIGCRNMNANAGTPASYIECMQWMLAPTNLKDKNPDPDLAADVVSNSWTCPPSEGCTVGDELRKAVNQVNNGGILFVAAAANAGPSCSTITDPPAIYANSFDVGATNSSDVLASFSSRGPVLKDSGGQLRKIKPDVSAPGVQVYSSYPPNTYALLSGTSMAAPHVAGSAALLMSAVPALKGHPNAVARLLRKTATTDGVTDPVNQTCGGTSPTDWPNYMLGHGRIDVYAAYLAATSLGAEISDEP